MAGAGLIRVNMTQNNGVKGFEEDVKRAILTAGMDAKHVVFLIKDAQVHLQGHSFRRYNPI